MGIMWYWVDARLQDIREDALQKIAIEYSIPSGHKNDPQFSLFTVTNNSSQTLSSRHRIVCSYVKVIGSNNGVIGPDIHFTELPGVGWMAMGGPLNQLALKPAYSEIEPGGDAQTSSCMNVFHLSPFICGDVIVSFQYYLRDQPEILQEKRIRIVTFNNGDGTFEWYKQSLNAVGSYCPVKQH
jgi:hypothetical protein